MAYGTLKQSKVNKIIMGSRTVWEIVLDYVASTALSTRDGVQLNLATLLAVNHPSLFPTDSFGGFLLSVETQPGRYGDFQTNLASVMHMKLYDYRGTNIANIASQGFDVMENVLYNRSSSAIERVYADPPIILDSELCLNISSMKTRGAEGRIILWIEK